ncbi:NUDIX hydrolase [Streptomyces sp. NPDC048272]|uniref:NUDIX hydrolase n=1 Tax=Streptomyces sp. NPDC048272 TaxID=3154616 RepID=UPI00342CFD10
MTDTTEPPPRVSMAVIALDGRLLMIRRRQKEGRLLWALPGGGIEGDESAEQAAVREVAEETSLDVKALHVIGQRIHPDSGADMTYVACEPVGGEARVEDAEELAEVAWITLDEIPQYVPWGLFPAVQEYLEGALTA